MHLHLCLLLEPLSGTFLFIVNCDDVYDCDAFLFIGRHIFFIYYFAKSCVNLARGAVCI